MSSNVRRNRYAFGLGTLGRDMLYTMVSMYFMFFLTDVLDLSDSTMWYMTGALTVLRIFDAVNDPLMGVLVDNTRSRWGKFKPWIALGGLASVLLTIMLFTDFGLRGTAYVLSFILIYLSWDIVFGANDIAYWSMIPALTVDQGERERIGSFAKICASLGMYVAIIAIPAVTRAMGNEPADWTTLAVAVGILMMLFLLFPILGVREDRSLSQGVEKTKLNEVVGVLFRNDQLLYTGISMGLFMIGYLTTTSFGIYFFKYAFRNEAMYQVFAGILGISQLTALAVFPLLMKRMTRRRLYDAAILMVTAGYIIFFFSPMNIIPIGIAGIILFIGQAFIQVLMLMFLADTVEYGQWKLKRRNESITFSVQPFINKIGGAIASGIVGVTLILSGINSAAAPEEVTPEGLFLLKAAMMILPLLFILVSYLVYRAKYRLHPEFYEEILRDLKARGEQIPEERE